MAGNGGRRRRCRLPIRPVSRAIFVVVVVVVAVVVVVSVTVAPGPVFSLLFGTQLAEIPLFVAMVFAGPLMVINHLVVIPHVIVAIVGVLNPVGMMFGTGGARYRTCQRRGQQA